MAPDTSSDRTNATPLRTSSVAVGGLVWLAAALGVGASGVLQSLAPPAPQLVLLGVMAACLVVVLGVSRVRAWALAVDARALVAFHLTRFVGIYFLVLYGRGELPYAFAVVGGWGDIVVAVSALGLLAWGGARGGELGGGTPRGLRRLAYAVWNVYGFADIVLVIITAARSSIADPGSMRPLQRLPLNLLLTFVVPIVVVTHLVLGYRLARGKREPGTPD
jgi:hypothetical protein